jgi:hypothetical protein
VQLAVSQCTASDNGGKEVSVSVDCIRLID